MTTRSGGMVGGVESCSGSMRLPGVEGPLGGVCAIRHKPAARSTETGRKRILLYDIAWDEPARSNDRLDNRGHGAFGAGQAPVRAIGVDLIPAEFGLAPFADDEHGTDRHRVV